MNNKKIKITAYYEEYSWDDFEDYYNGVGNQGSFEKDFEFDEYTSFKDIMKKIKFVEREGNQYSDNGDYDIKLDYFNIENFTFYENDYSCEDGIYKYYHDNSTFSEDIKIYLGFSMCDMTIRTINDNNTDFDLVELRDDGNIGRKTPHCKKHGAMNKVSEFYWRCSASKIVGCRAGCIEED